MILNGGKTKVAFTLGKMVRHIFSNDGIATKLEKIKAIAKNHDVIF